MEKHYCIVMACEPRKKTVYRAICGYESVDLKEFTSTNNPSTAGTTCPACLEKLGQSVLIVERETP